MKGINFGPMMDSISDVDIIPVGPSCMHCVRLRVRFVTESLQIFSVDPRSIAIVEHVNIGATAIEVALPIFELLAMVSVVQMVTEAVG